MISRIITQCIKKLFLSLTFYLSYALYRSLSWDKRDTFDRGMNRLLVKASKLG